MDKMYPSMNNFKKYHSIDNAYQTKTVESFGHYTSPTDEWVVLEKAHGSNLMFCITADGVDIGRRTAIMSKEEASKFYNSLEVYNKYLPNIKKVWELLGSSKTVIIYGELMGGLYPNMQSPTPTTVPVQKQVLYCPQTEFYAFDIAVLDEEFQYLDYDICENIFKETGFVYARSLYRGSYKEAMEWSSQHNADPTTIPELFGLTAVPNNIREGHVIKPVISKLMNNGSRIILKDKNARFAEKKKNTVIPKEKDIMTSNMSQELLDSSLLYVTEARLDNVTSKNGPVTDDNVNRMIGLLVQDALQDIKKDFDTKTLSPIDFKKMTTALASEARKLVLAAR